jgi:hypothetical protein
MSKRIGVTSLMSSGVGLFRLMKRDYKKSRVPGLAGLPFFRTGEFSSASLQTCRTGQGEGGETRAGSTV